MFRVLAAHCLYIIHSIPFQLGKCYRQISPFIICLNLRIKNLEIVKNDLFLAKIDGVENSECQNLEDSPPTTRLDSQLGSNTAPSPLDL